MSTSIHRGLVLFGSALYGAGADPLDTAIVRDGVANGLLHCADVCGQVRVAYLPPVAAISNADDFETIDSSPTATQWYRVSTQPFGDWPLTLRADGTPYGLRIRAAVAASVSSSATLTLRVVIAPLDEVTAVAELGAHDDHVWETSWAASSVGTTGTWVTGATKGTAHPTLMRVSRRNAGAWTQMVPASDAVSGGRPQVVQQVPVAAHVWAKTTSALTLPRLHGLFLQEYIAP